MRFAIRLILSKWRGLIESGCTAKSKFLPSAIEAVDHNSRGIQNVRLSTAKALGNIVLRCDWRFRERGNHGLLLLEHQPGNVSMHKVQLGIKRVLKELDAVLEEDGSKGKEFSDSEESEDELSRIPQPMTVTKARSSAGSDQRHLNETSASYSFPNEGLRRVRHQWTLVEDLELLKIEEAQPNTSFQGMADELNRRMTEIRRKGGAPLPPARSRGAIRSRLKYLARIDARISNLEDQQKNDEKASLPRDGGS